MNSATAHYERARKPKKRPRGLPAGEAEASGSSQTHNTYSKLRAASPISLKLQTIHRLLMNQKHNVDILAFEQYSALHNELFLNFDASETEDEGCGSL